MFKGLEVGKEQKGRPGEKLESDDEGFRRMSCRGEGKWAGLRCVSEMA